ncbi:hypothetical protein ACUR5C_09325 [Aliikangiella sp. IMCC44653]
MDANNLLNRVFSKMLARASLCFSLGLLGIANAYSQTTTSYFYLDQYGNPVYSDKPPPKKKNFTSKSIQPVNTTNWENTTKAPTNTPIKPKQSNKKQESPKLVQCQQIDNSIKKTEARLRLKLAVSEFDQLKLKLTKLRWQKQTKC